MDPLKKKFEKKAIALFHEYRSILKEHGDKKADEVKLSQIFGGMRGVKSMIWETSNLDAHEGIKFRGYSIPQLQKILPSKYNCKQPLPEGLFWLMLTGEIPNDEQVKWLADEWERRGEVPAHTTDLINAMPNDLHPMAQLSSAIVSMHSESIFAKRYAEGMKKTEYWDATYEDAMNLIAKLPRVAAHIYRKIHHNNESIGTDNRLDWAANYAHQLGFDNPEFRSLMRLYLTIHADHEGGNASAHTAHLVNSTLSDPYLSFASGMNALAGPLHGLANQEVLKFILGMIEELGTDEPSNEQVADYVNLTLQRGKVIPGYGHAVLRQPDPRFTAQRIFAEEYINDSNLIKIVWKLFEVVPPILKGLGKVKNPWPNVDAHSGAILTHYGLKEYSYYTVLFGVSRALGVMASMCWTRALGFPIERPKSVTMDWVRSFIKT
ncbi:MAG: citrate (Si)-synthase [Saprospiraceae bacterium]